MSNFHERLSELRKSKKMTQKELADFLNVNVRTVQYYESGNKKPGFDVLVLLSDTFGVSTDYLLGTTDDPIPSKKDVSDITPEELEFQKWAQENLMSSFFYDLNKNPDRMKKDMWDALREVWKREKGRKPGQKQGE